MMKSMTMYRLSNPTVLPPGAIDEALSRRALADPLPTQQQSHGWMHVTPEDKQFVTGIGPYVLRYGLRDRVLPPSVVSDEVEDRCVAFEEGRGYRPGRKQKLAIKDEVMMALLPRAFIKTRSILVYLDLQHGWVCVGHTGELADDVLSGLRGAFDDGLYSGAESWWDQPFSLEMLMTEWVARKSAPGELDIGSNALLARMDDVVAQMKYVNRPPLDEGAQSLISSGFRAHELQLIYKNRLQFTMTNGGRFKRIRFLEFMDQSPEREGEELDIAAEAEIFLGDFKAMVSELAETSNQTAEQAVI